MTHDRAPSTEHRLRSRLLRNPFPRCRGFASPLTPQGLLYGRLDGNPFETHVEDFHPGPRLVYGRLPCLEDLHIGLQHERTRIVFIPMHLDLDHDALIHHLDGCLGRTLKASKATERRHPNCKYGIPKRRPLTLRCEQPPQPRGKCKV